MSVIDAWGKCETCQYWFKHEEPTFPDDPPGHGRRWEGECRIKAPNLVINERSTRFTEWPQTDAIDWCGQWQLKAGLSRPVRLP